MTFKTLGGERIPFERRPFEKRKCKDCTFYLHRRTDGVKRKIGMCRRHGTEVYDTGKPLTRDCFSQS